MVRRISRSPKPADEYDEPAEDDEQQRRRPPLRRQTRNEASSNGRAKPKPPERQGRSRGPAQPEEGDDGVPIRTGWGGYRTTKKEAPSKFAERYQPPDEGEDLIYFLEDGPYASFLQHWCDWMPKGQKKSFICLGVDTDCPLCDIDTPSAQSCFNILDLNGDEPRLKVWQIGITLSDALLKYAEDDKVGPLSRLDYYFGVQKSGDKKKTTSIRPIKARDVEEDWEYQPLSEDEVEEFMSKLWNEESLDRSTRAELRKVAAMATD